MRQVVMSLILGLAACSESDVRGSCEYGGVACVEYLGDWTDDQLEDARGLCAIGGTWGDMACERDEAVNGCRITTTQDDRSWTTIDWYAPGGLTEEELRARCDRRGGEFVLPDDD